MARNQKKIGLLCNNFIRRRGEKSSAYAGLDWEYIWAVAENGGIPVLLPSLGRKEAEPSLKGLDGLILTGGGDLDPVLFGEEPLEGVGPVDRGRNEYEIHLVKRVLEKGLPILGICLGIQVINVAMGGTLYQDIYSQKVTSMQHFQKDIFSFASHEIFLERDSILRSWAGRARVRVNSYHHQAVKKVGGSLRVTARTRDGVIEALEGTGSSFVLGVQFHPERMFRQDPFCRKIFRNFIHGAAGK